MENYDEIVAIILEAFRPNVTTIHVVVIGILIINEVTRVHGSELRNDSRLAINGKLGISACARRFYLHVTETLGRWCTCGSIMKVYLGNRIAQLRQEVLFRDSRKWDFTRYVSYLLGLRIGRLRANYFIDERYDY